MLEQIKSWFQLAEIGQSRSSITNPLQWTLVILIGGIILFWCIKVPPFVTYILVGAFVVVFVIFVYTYLYFMHKQPDVLRSENFHLSKMAIEHGLLGDSIHGLLTADELKADPPRLSSASSGAEPKS
ncbi:MAG TPA: hypothetical protein VGG46_11055 [Terriglobales bacterium]|jgi:hypothetical protein